MKKTFFFTIVVFYYFAKFSRALQCYRCGHLAVDGVSTKFSNRHFLSPYSSFDESCETSRIPSSHFLSLCGKSSNTNSDEWCTKVFIKGFMKRVSVQVHNTLRDCVQFPTGWLQGCNDWTKADLLNSTNIPVDFKRLASYFADNATMQICTCKEDGCNIKPILERPSQSHESFWRKLGNIGINNDQHYVYGKRFAELLKRLSKFETKTMPNKYKNVAY